MARRPEAQRWQCQACRSFRVTDRLLGVVAETTEVHRLTCEDCKAVSHYDRAGNPPTASLAGRFRVVAGASGAG